MKGLEICRKYFFEYALPKIKEEFPECEKFLAAGLVGSGSECYGYDDEISKDHDFEVGFCLFVPGEDIISRRTSFLLERMYDKLPKEYMGLKKSVISPAGGNRHGVMEICHFYEEKTGTPSGELTVGDWLNIPPQFLFEATNGEVFIDNYGEFTSVREKLCRYPEDIRLKKIAGNMIMIDQTGLYNYDRCIKHGEKESAQLVVGKFTESVMETVFLLNNRYSPYYKWKFRAFRELDENYGLLDPLNYLLTSNNTDDLEKKKKEIIRVVDIVRKAVAENFGVGFNTIDRMAYELNGNIKDINIRNMNILSGVRD